MTKPGSEAAERSVCHLEWFINSRCDYTCNGCVPAAPSSDKPDLPLEPCLEALESFAMFAAERKAEARITFYPRQAAFTEPFMAVLDAVRSLKTPGLIHKVTCANRGDLPSHKIRLYRDRGVDTCRLTIDGPAPIHDALRREGSFLATLKAFHEARNNGIQVLPLAILVKYNAPHLTDTLRLLTDEGFERCLVQAGIHDDAGRVDTKTGDHPDPHSRWDELLTAGEYRAVLLQSLTFLDSLGDPHRAFRARFIQDHPMYARLFLELGRMAEYEQLAASKLQEDILPFVLKPDGAVHSPGNIAAIGRFPGGTFKKMYEASHPLRWFKQGADRETYESHKQREFAKCRDCSATRHCRPTLVAAQGHRLLYGPDVHCWVDGRRADLHGSPN